MSKYVIFSTKGYIFMKTRVEKLESRVEEYAPRRVSKNTKLYDEIKNSELDNFNLGSNAKVIGDNESQIDINKIKEILEKNYQEEPKKRSMKFDFPEENLELEKTREYDINAIIEQAREEKEVDYQKERLKKIRDTQFDILKSLELEAKEQAENNNQKTKEELLELINTINLNEVQNKIDKVENEEEKEIDPLDILSDLRGDDNTVVVGAKEFTEEMKTLEMQEIAKESKEEADESIENSFYTNSMTFDKKDFSDFDDLKEPNGNVLIKVFIVLLLVAIVVGTIIFLNEFLNLNWF